MADPISRLVTGLLARQDPDAKHTLLTRILISGIILFAGVVMGGFFGVMGAVVVYLLGVELMDLDLRWMYAPILLALIVGLRSALSCLLDYWRNFGHG